MITEYDELEIYCRMLGHPLHFSYCRTTDGDKPCSKILDCWFKRIPILEFAEKHFSEETLRQISGPPKNRLHSILELIEQAEKTKIDSGEKPD